MRAGMHWPTGGMIRGRCRPISATKIFSTRCDIRNCRQRVSKTFGETRAVVISKLCATCVRDGDGMSQLQSINHIVVLMLENRSFDCLLGTLYPTSNSFKGLNGTEQNPDASGTPG